MATNRKPCSTKGCKQGRLKEGLCFRCYKAKHGVPPYACKHDGCNKTAVRGGLCMKHRRGAAQVEEQEEATRAETPRRKPIMISDRSEYISALKRRRAELMEELSMINTSLRVVEEFTR
ncbi:MAG: hypothetical protein M0024_01440 [Nitrospiraceae bacterium]|nr:hypothetical protein [Nitrospiraceae bacterium]